MSQYSAEALAPYRAKVAKFLLEHASGGLMGCAFTPDFVARYIGHPGNNTQVVALLLHYGCRVVPGTGTCDATSLWWYTRAADPAADVP